MAGSPLKDTKFRYLFAGCWLLWAALHHYIIYTFTHISSQALADSLTTNILLAGCCMLIINNMKYYLPERQQFWYVVMVSVGLTFVWAWIYGIFQWLLADKLRLFPALDERADAIRFLVVLLIMVCCNVISMYWYSTQNQAQHESRQKEAERLAREAELNKLRQQMQPHFLFNSLNSINALIGTQPAAARNMVQQLSGFLRGTLKQEENTLTTLQNELEHLQLYLDIEKIRFGHRLNTDIIFDGSTATLQLPAMLLQPVVENSIKFGLYGTTGSIVIKINTYVQEKQLVITVENPFDPDTAAPQKGTGFGLSAVQRRLHLLYGQQQLLQTHTENNKFVTTITIPQLV